MAFLLIKLENIQITSLPIYFKKVDRLEIVRFLAFSRDLL